MVQFPPRAGLFAGTRGEVASVGYQPRACLVGLASAPAPRTARGATNNSNVPVDGGDPLVASGDKQLALDELLDGKNHTVFAPQSDGRAAILDRFGGIFYLPSVNTPSYRR